MLTQKFEGYKEEEWSHVPSHNRSLSSLLKIATGINIPTQSLSPIMNQRRHLPKRGLEASLSSLLKIATGKDVSSTFQHTLFLRLWIREASRWKICRNVPLGERDCADSYWLKEQSYHDHISGTKDKNWLFFEPWKLVFFLRLPSIYKYILEWGWEICRMSSVM